MKTIIILGNITIFLVALTVTESMRLSENDRKKEFTALKTLKQLVASKYLRKYNAEEASELLGQYIMNSHELIEFAEYLNKTGNVPEWSKTMKLKNPKFYEILRYNNLVDFIPLKKEITYQIATNLKMTIFKDSPSISIEKLVHFYKTANLNELISLEDYYAINVLLIDRNQMFLPNPVGWRIKTALYSLAIRQYSLNLNFNFSPKNCFIRVRGDANYVNGFEVGSHSKLSDFWFFKSHNVFEESDSNSPIYNDNNPSNWVSYKFVITEPRVIVNLEEVVKNDKKLYVLLPRTDFVVLKKRLIYDTFFGLTSFIKAKTTPILNKSNWITNMANKIEEYKKMEEKYFDNLPLLSSSGDESE
ncbi:uncharacterized protein LOC122505050 [Leptopilina heterotoma]|uniref:uncharacterized protein LOC122505050 n=1 Tax=Leptopilina heterotoma TaxID=63436 RepID=UPI001CA88DF8|nr:uncharacterized protein LOC122505050 [Leptopilina heterotoma]